MEVIIGKYNKIQRETYAECARVWVDERSEDGMYLVKVIDRVLYVYKKSVDDEWIPAMVCSTFDLSI